MNLDHLKSNWEKGKQRITEKYRLNQKEMEAIIKNQSDQTTKRLSRVFLMGIVVQSTTLVIQLINLIRYAHITDLTLVIIGTIIMITPALFYTINRYRTLQSSDFYALSLAESLKQKIAFYKFSYNQWLLSFALSFVVFLWSVNMLAGDFTSFQEFNIQLIFLYAACFLLIYFSYRYAHTRYLREYEISLDDLGGKQLTDLRQESLRFRRFKMILIAILLLVLLTGIVWLVII